MSKFESIKLRIMQGRKLLPFQTASVIQDHEDRLKTLENGSSGSGSSGSGDLASDLETLLDTAIEEEESDSTQQEEEG